MDRELLKHIGITERPGKSPKILSCTWKLPLPGTVKANVDGTSYGNPGPSAAGVVFRKQDGEVTLVLEKGLGITTNFMAECWAILLAAEQAFIQGWLRLWIVSDSQAAVAAFMSERLPWLVKGRWTICKRKMLHIRISHIFRKWNFAADMVSKHGVGLQEGTLVLTTQRPSWLGCIESPFCTYYRFS
ncbi:hypothetical protein ACHQM5_025728 [Ranunculus cassubicifolius]